MKPHLIGVPHDAVLPYSARIQSESQGRRRSLLPALLAPVLLAACASSSPTPHATTSTPSPVVSDVVPVIECPSMYANGNPGPPSGTYPDTMAVSAPASVADQLAFYSNDTRSLPPILGPRGWSCQVAVGEDGTTGVEVFPSTTSPPSAYSELSADVEQVSALWNSGCRGCIYGTVCPFVSNAADQQGYGPGSGVTFPCSKRPAQEKVSFAKGSPSDAGPVVEDVINFTDPAGVKGDGEPSGGPYAAVGVVLYDWTADVDAASEETCLLAAPEQALCSTITQDFVNRDWMMLLVEDCGVGAAVSRPQNLILTCADGNERAADLSWSSWGPIQATATGIDTWNTCVPNCAASTVWDRTAAEVTLTDPVLTGSHGWLFEKLTVQDTGNTPPDKIRVFTVDEAPAGS